MLSSFQIQVQNALKKNRIQKGTPAKNKTSLKQSNLSFQSKTTVHIKPGNSVCDPNQCLPTSERCINICLLVCQPQTIFCKYLFSKSNTSGRSTKAWGSNVARSANDARGADLMAMIINTDHVLMRMLKLLLMTVILREQWQWWVTEPVSPTTPGLAGWRRAKAATCRFKLR